MKIMYGSDFHNDKYDNFKNRVRIPTHPSDKETYYCLVGDIDSRREYLVSALQELCDQFKQVLFVAGNHEFYDNVLGPLWFDTLQEDVNRDNIHIFRHGHTVFETNDVVFIGSTLWYDPQRCGTVMEGNARIMLQDCKYSEVQKHDDNDSITRLNLNEVRAYHLEAVKDISDALDQFYGVKEIVVLTHYQMMERIKLAAEGRPFIVGSMSIDHAYYNDLECLYDGLEGITTISGHNHSNYFLEIDKNFFACNCSGYHGENRNKTAFQSGAYINIKGN